MTTPPQPPILDYQRAERAKRTAAGGLILMGGGLAVIGGVALFAILMYFAREGFRSKETIPALILAIITAWGAAYIALGILIQRRYRIAAVIALVMTSIQSLAWLVILSIFAVGIYNDGYDTLARLIFVCLILLAITVGFLAIVYETWLALRSRELWY